MENSQRFVKLQRRQSIKNWKSRAYYRCILGYLTLEWLLFASLLLTESVTCEPYRMLRGEQTSSHPTKGLHRPTRGSYMQTLGRSSLSKQSRAISSQMSQSRELSQRIGIQDQTEGPTREARRNRKKSQRKASQTWCASLPGLVSRQRRICLDNPSLVEAAMKGTGLAVRECQRQFKYDRWNCSLILTKMSGFQRNEETDGDEIRGEVLPPGLRNATRESAFLHAIMSAGIAHAVTVACRSGELRGCRCSKNAKHKLQVAMDILKNLALEEGVNGERKKASKAALEALRLRRQYGASGFRKSNLTITTWTSGRLGTPSPPEISWGKEYEQINWGGCNDDVKFGMKFSRRFVEAPFKDVPLREKTPRDFVKLHNWEVGRRMIQLLTKVHCRCHGMSGSCASQTCWSQMATFEEVGDALRSKYMSGIQTAKDTRRRRRLWHKTVQSYDIDSGRLRRIPKTELAYINETPNLCVQNEELGIEGTAGRQCLKHSGDSGDCRYLCCGRGYNTARVRIWSQCKCKFIWCCDVQCEMCEEIKYEHVCKD